MKENVGISKPYSTVVTKWLDSNKHSTIF